MKLGNRNVFNLRSVLTIILFYKKSIPVYRNAFISNSILFISYYLIIIFLVADSPDSVSILTR